jgi:tetratricopeptide (TPR) repeat protein
MDKRQKAKGIRQKLSFCFSFCLLPSAFCIFLALPPSAAAQTATSAPIVVLPFDNPDQEPRLAWLREGAAILMSDALSARGADVVTREERLQAFDRLQLPAAATLSRASSIRVGQALAASTVVSGTLHLRGDQLTIVARAIQLEQGRLDPDVDESGSMASILTMFPALAQELLVGGAPRADTAPVAPSPEAFELYVKGLIADTPSAAVAFLEQALKAAPRFDRARIAMWELHAESSAHQRALDVISAVGSDSPLYRESRFRRGLSLMQLKRFDDAMQTLRVMQSEEPSATVANAIGVIELRRAATHQPGRATYYFSQASELDPADGDLFFNLGYSYWLDKDAKAAIYWLREAVRRDATDGDAHFILGVALQQAGAGAEAARERELAERLSSKYKGWTARTPGGDPVPRGLERLHEELRPARARVDSALISAGQRDQDALAAFHLDAGRRAFEREADREAVQELRRALYISPYLAEAHVLLGRLYLRGGRPSEAVEELKVAIWSEATPAAHVALAEAYLQAQDQAAARAEIERALALDSRFQPALALRAKLGG